MKYARKILALVLALFLVTGMLPVSVSAAVETCICQVRCTEKTLVDSGCTVCIAFDDPSKCQGTEIAVGTTFTYNGIVYEIRDPDSRTVFVSRNFEASGDLVIPEEVFYGDMSYRVTGIVNNAFKESTLEAVRIPDSVTTIEKHAFLACANLKSIAIPQSVTRIENNTFEECTSLTEVAIPDSVTSISSWAFKDCSSLISITVPDGVAVIEERTFSGCSSLTTVHLSKSLTEIEDYAFEDCFALRNITIPNNVETIRSGVFFNCSGLTEITIPASVTYMESFIFSGCTSLENIRVIMGRPKTITDNTFEYVTAPIAYQYAAPENLYWEGRTLRWEDFGFPYVRYKIEAENLSSDSGLLMGSRTYYTTGNAYDLSSYMIQPGTYRISVTAVMPEIISIDEPNYHSSERVTVETEYTFPEETPSDEFVIDGLGYRITGESTVTVISADQSIRNCVIPESVTYENVTYQVTAIGPSAFGGNTAITGVTVPGTVKRIEKWAFRQCCNLSQVTLNEGLEYIGEGALEELAITELILPESVTEIGVWAFANDKKLKTVYIGKNVTRIGYCAFLGCTSLPTVTLPDSLEDIGRETFVGCSGLKEIIIYGEGPAFVGENAYNGITPTYILHTPGDINGDGEVNNKDLTRLFQFLSGYEVEVVEAALDVNGDSSVNNKDLTRLFQFFSGYEVEIF